jgi:hypothetical protein
MNQQQEAVVSGADKGYFSPRRPCWSSIGTIRQRTSRGLTWIGHGSGLCSCTACSSASIRSSTGAREASAGRDR